MSAPIFACINKFECLASPEDRLGDEAKAYVVQSRWKGAICLTVDSLLFITALVIVVLGATSVLQLPPALSYSLIGFGILIVLPYIAVGAFIKCYEANDPVKAFQKVDGDIYRNLKKNKHSNVH